MNDIFPGKRWRRLRNKLSIFNAELDAILDGITGPVFKGLTIYGIGEKFVNVKSSIKKARSLQIGLCVSSGCNNDPNRDHCLAYEEVAVF